MESTMIKFNHQWRAVLVVILFFTLTGCPDYATYRQPDETTNVTKTAAGMCFNVANVQDYQLVTISIFPRGTPHQERWYKFGPDLNIHDNQFCVPPSLYTFPDSGQFLVEYVLSSKTKEDQPRNVVVGFELNSGFELNNGHPNGIALTEREIFKP